MSHKGRAHTHKKNVRKYQGILYCESDHIGKAIPLNDQAYFIYRRQWEGKSSHPCPSIILFSSNASFKIQRGSTMLVKDLC